MQVLRTVLCIVWRCWFCVQSLPQAPKETGGCSHWLLLHSFHSVFQNFRNFVLPSIDLSEMFSFSNSFIFEGLLLFWDKCLPYSLPLYIPASISQVVVLQACAVVIPSFNLFLSFLSYFILCISVFKIT